MLRTQLGLSISHLTVYVLLPPLTTDTKGELKTESREKILQYSVLLSNSSVVLSDFIVNLIVISSLQHPLRKNKLTLFWAVTLPGFK